MATTIGDLISSAIDLGQVASGQELAPIVLESNLLPPIALTGGEPSALTSAVVWILRPALRNVPVVGTVAPYGEPAGYGTVIFYGVAIAAVIGLVYLWRRP